MCDILGYYGVVWKCFTDASGQRIGPTFKRQEPKKKRLFTLEHGTDMLSRNVGKQLPHDAA
jgi:hypothetical protein